MNPSKIFERMREDHRNVLERIRVLDVAAAAIPREAAGDWPGAETRQVLALLRRQFQTHMAAEDEVLYPALAEALPVARPSMDPLMADHGALRMMLADLEQELEEPASDARNEQIGVQLRDLADLLRIHIRKEEAVVFTIAERALNPREVEALAARMDRGPAGQVRSPQGPAAGPSKGAVS
ncbi:MAG TPA: hemerythrin domain-containing protein [Candidatus Eisenbacteria bacterium]|nr:hemerythrin domain-containing protein [Candidatus Eisenbacteria bacterium]